MHFRRQTDERTNEQTDGHRGVVNGEFESARGGAYSALFFTDCSRITQALSDAALTVDNESRWIVTACPAIDASGR